MTPVVVLGVEPAAYRARMRGNFSTAVASDRNARHWTFGTIARRSTGSGSGVGQRLSPNGRHRAGLTCSAIG